MRSENAESIHLLSILSKLTGGSLSQCRYQLSPRACWHVFFLVISFIGIELISFEGSAQVAGMEVSAPSKVSIYQSNYDLRQHRKMGVGGSIGGPLGVLGIFTELNLRKQDSVVAGLGAGSGYNSFLMRWKRSFESSLCMF